MWPATNIEPGVQYDSPRASENTFDSFIDGARFEAGAIAPVLYLANNRLLHSANLHTKHGPETTKDQRSVSSDRLRSIYDHAGSSPVYSYSTKHGEAPFLLRSLCGFDDTWPVATRHLPSTLQRAVIKLLGRWRLHIFQQPAHGSHGDFFFLTRSFPVY